MSEEGDGREGFATSGDESSPFDKRVGEVSIISASELTGADMTSLSVFEGVGNRDGESGLVSTEQPDPRVLEMAPGEAIPVAPSAVLANGTECGGEAVVKEDIHGGAGNLSSGELTELSLNGTPSADLKENLHEGECVSAGAAEEEKGIRDDTRLDGRDEKEFVTDEHGSKDISVEKPRESQRTESSEILEPASGETSPVACPIASEQINEGEGSKCNGKDPTRQGEATKSEGVESSSVGDHTSRGKEPEWVDILGSGELLKKVEQPGKGLSTRPSQQARVKLRTRGILRNKDGPDKSVDKHSAVSFTVGDGDVIQAWDIAVSLMEVGEVAKVKTSARFAYGAIGQPPNIPPNAELMYELELLEVLPPVQLDKISEQDLVGIVDVKKTRGNELYKQGEFLRALNSYHKGRQAVQGYLDARGLAISEAPPTVQEMLIRCENNIAAAQLKVENYREALASCESVLKLDANNLKALYRAGRVQAHLGEWQAAVSMLEKAAALDPDNTVVQAELKKTIKKRDTSTEKEKEMYRRMVGGTAKKTRTKPSKVADGHRSWGPWPYMAIAGVIAVLAIGTSYFLTQRP